MESVPTGRFKVGMIQTLLGSGIGLFAAGAI
jgi:hypothetical protein